jgi:DNA uptake protein ComE-like DNA-binding protein
MKRFTALPTLLSLSAMVTVAACSSGTNKAADTTAVADTSMVAPTTTDSATIPAASTTGASGAAIVPVNINTASDAEILKIPGVGPRMLREFKEYRPWTSIEQFRREIGKYVDKAEVARLEKYIVIK